MYDLCMFIQIQRKFLNILYLGYIIGVSVEINFIYFTVLNVLCTFFVQINYYQ
jgi:hypothetical protein